MRSIQDEGTKLQIHVKEMDTDEEQYSLEDYSQNGFAGPLTILSPQQVQVALNEVYREFQLSSCCHPPDNHTRTNARLQGNRRFKLHLFLPEIHRIVQHPTLVQAVRTALQTPHIALWSSDLNIKLPHTPNFFSVHQDGTYTGLQPAQKCVTVWIALSDPVSHQEGCMSFLKSSHSWGQLPHVEEPEQVHNLLSRGQRVVLPPKSDDPEEWVSIPLCAGQATMHHFHTVHQSSANQSSQPRVGLALRYMAADVRQTGPVRESVTWIENMGHAQNSIQREQVAEHFDLEPSLPEYPSEKDLERGRRAHQDAMQREAQNYFHDSENIKAYDERIKL